MDARLRAWLMSVTGAPDVRVARSMTFGVASNVALIEAGERVLVLRTYGRHGLIEEIPGVVANEVRALASARRYLGDVVPDSIASDPSGDAAGCPAVLMTFRPGSPVVRGVDVARLAAPIARLHASPLPEGLPPVHHWIEPARMKAPEWTSAPATWARLVDLVHEPEPDAAPVFLHRDYHTGNVLWSAGEISGIIDWAVAGAGPRGMDLAHTRANLALVDGVDAADAYLAAYAALVPEYRHDPWWDAAAVLGFSDFSGVLAFNAFGAGIDLDTLHARADLYAASLAC